MITSKQMVALEKSARQHGILPTHLMEEAGKQVFLAVKERFNLSNSHIIIFAGSGNNGGDGFVAARHFAEECPTIVLFFGELAKLSEEALENYKKIKDKITIAHVSQPQDLNEFHFQKNLHLIFIDALLGTGVKGEIREPYVTGIKYFNNHAADKIAVDIPSGLNPDTGDGTLYCQPDLIITFHDVKIGLEKFKDKTLVVDIGIPTLA
jgi:hydroxyethylthiazole kinase-like uncharacterized protein yjeF